MIQAESETIRLKDGRTLSFARYGDLGGFPIIGFHGLPGSRVLMRVFESAARGVGAYMISPERPGFGFSDPNPKGTLLGYCDDVSQLADALGLNQFAVLGVSGGGPYALASACQLSERLTAAAVVSGIGPLSAPGALHKMARINRWMFSLARFSPGLAGWILASGIRSSLPKMMEHVRHNTSPAPLISPDIFALIAADQAESIRSGRQGFVLDLKNLWRPWGFAFEEISIKVLLFHGEADDLAPTHLAHTIADRLENCAATFYPGEDHTGPLIHHAAEIMQAIARERGGDE